MASVSVAKASGAGTGALLFACVAEHGSAVHPYFCGETLSTGPDSARNLADAVHFLTTLHGRHPGVVDLAGGRALEPAARAWLSAAGEAMAVERLYLTRLAVAVGPVPSTPGAAGSTARLAAWSITPGWRPCSMARKWTASARLRAACGPLSNSWLRG